MKKLLIISAVFPPEPVVSASLSFDIASSFSKKITTTVLSPKPTRPLGFKFSETKSGFDFEHVQANSYTCPQSNVIGRLKESFSFGKYSYKYILNTSGIDCIYANTWPLLAQFYTAKAAKKKNIPLIVHIQDIYPESLAGKVPLIGSIFNLLLLPIDKYVLRNATHIIAISENMKSYISKTRNIKPEKITVVQNWQDDSPFLNSAKLKEQKSDSVFTFMYLGNIGPVAGLDTVIEAFVNANLTNCRLIIAGSGSMKENLEKQAKEFANSKIEFWNVPEGKVAETQAKADILLLPIKKGAALSSVPSKLPSYMLSKKTIIASVDPDSDTARCIQNAGCGYIVEPENSVQLSECMATVVKLTQQQRNQLGEKGFTYAQKNLTKAVNLDKIVQLIERNFQHV